MGPVDRVPPGKHAMTRNMRFVLMMFILSGLIALALFTLVLSRRPAGNADPALAEGAGDVGVLDGPALVDQPIDLTQTTEQRQVDGTTVTLTYAFNKVFVTASEESLFGLAPLQPDTSQPADQVPPDQAQAPADQTATPTVPAPVDTTTIVVPSAVVGSGEQIITTPYTVQAGDNLYQISRRQDTSMALMAAYGIDANDMVVGQVINLPVVNPAYCASFRGFHLVLEGDTVFRIAQKHASTVDDLIRVNGLGPDALIRTNTVLCLP